MITRIGLFEGTVKAGREAAFDAFVETTMRPLWRAFPGLVDLEVRRGEIEGGVRYPLVTVFRFADRAALEGALASPERQRSLEATRTLLAMFDGRVVHQVLRPFPSAPAAR